MTDLTSLHITYNAMSFLSISDTGQQNLSCTKKIENFISCSWSIRSSLLASTVWIEALSLKLQHIMTPNIGWLLCVSKHTWYIRVTLIVISMQYNNVVTKPMQETMMYDMQSVILCMQKFCQYGFNIPLFVYVYLIYNYFDFIFGLLISDSAM